MDCRRVCRSWSLEGIKVKNAIGLWCVDAGISQLYNLVVTNFILPMPVEVLTTFIRCVPFQRTKAATLI